MMSDRSEATAAQQSSLDAVPQVSVIVPTRNEAHNIRPLLAKLVEALHGLDAEVLFVDDSTDDTSQVVAAVTDQFAIPVRLLARSPEQRNGLSGAVVDGFRAVRGEWVCVMDADLQHPPETIPRMWEQAQKTGADMVVGSRRGDLIGPLGLTRMRSFTSKSLTILARMLFPRLLRNVSDPLTGLFLVRHSAVDVDVLQPDGFKILLEILVRCPALHVTEIHFDFAPRHEGESKADVREGIRFFRHLVRLRITVNPHLIRFLLVIILGIIGNTLFLLGLVEWLGLDYRISALLAAEGFVLWAFYWFENWVFRERKASNTSRRIWVNIIFAQLFLILIYLPLMVMLTSSGIMHYLPANLVAIAVVGFVRYALSEQWIWTKGSIVWQPETFFYNVHDILIVESQVPLAELQYFKVDATGEVIDIQIRVDRQGTPSQLPGGISYDERLGRFGFGLTVLPGAFLQVIVSPLLERSPSFLFTNVVEPILRWTFVRKGFALVKAAGLASGESAILIHGGHDMGQAMSILCTRFGYGFMADDLSIIGKGGIVYGFPKPVTINQNMVSGESYPSGFRERISLFGQRLLYTRFARRIGLWLSDLDLPAASLNTYLQWLVPQPKYMIGDVVDGIRYSDSADGVLVVGIGEKQNQKNDAVSLNAYVHALQQKEETASFQPGPLLAERLRIWQDSDLMREERAIIRQALHTAELRWFESKDDEWWLELAESIAISELDKAAIEKPHHNLSFIDAQGEPGSS
ncbi:MAG: glycosyltransferase family 2 protein [Anaerolineaceae bacterium]|nr:MAG: glycosyltransferase family 2 protein [Anaerolineaceae bacterium]